MSKCKQGHCGMEAEKTMKDICCFYCIEKHNCEEVCMELPMLSELMLVDCNDFVK